MSDPIAVRYRPGSRSAAPRSPARSSTEKVWPMPNRASKFVATGHGDHRHVVVASERRDADRGLAG
jgi:hypothetical protein